MWQDPIVEEVRRVREAYAKRFNYDLEAIFKDLKIKEEQARASGRLVVKLPPRRIQTAEMDGNRQEKVPHEEPEPAGPPLP
jgi:hypothetical protein